MTLVKFRLVTLAAAGLMLACGTAGAQTKLRVGKAQPNQFAFVPADIGVEARVTSLGENVARSFETALAVQTYSIDLTAETTGTAEVVSMPPSTTVSYDPRFGSERVVEKARLVAGEVVDRVQAFARKRRR